jgi:uncharacterized protein YjbJ (UPF0337 family)
MGERGGMDKLKGKGKEMAGKVTGDDRRAAEGKADRAKGEAKDAMGSARDKAKGVRGSMKRGDS